MRRTSSTSSTLGLELSASARKCILPKPGTVSLWRQVLTTSLSRSQKTLLPGLCSGAQSAASERHRHQLLPASTYSIQQVRTIDPRWLPPRRLRPAFFWQTYSRPGRSGQTSGNGRPVASVCSWSKIPGSDQRGPRLDSNRPVATRHSSTTSTRKGSSDSRSAHGPA